ncbi:MAG: short-chain dehydrogenase, partial [Acidimicrobiia bacterium]
EQFLILPHPRVAEYFERKAGDYDRWLAGMRRLQARAGVSPF